tara:strand:- start:7656 stop:8297 length:642 start_codon:yes stop_codon:yes gene_type:complete
VLKIPEQKGRKSNIDENIEASYKEIADTVNQAKLPKKQSDDNILSELDQFSGPGKPKKQPKVKEPIVKEENVEQPMDELISDAPSPMEEGMNSFQQAPAQGSMSSDIQEVAESIVDEKWQELTAKLGDFNMWKDRVENEITAVKQEVIRTQSNFANLQRAVFGKVSEYNENISGLNTEMKALEKVFEKIMQPLTSNVKELGKITQKLKGKSKK